MEKAVLRDGMLLVFEFSSPVEAWAFEMAEKFEEARQQLQSDEITNENWVQFFEEMKAVNINEWPPH